MESMPAEPESKIQRRGKVAVEHRSGYALAAWFLEEIANLREIKKSLRTLKNLSVHSYCPNPTK